MSDGSISTGGAIGGGVSARAEAGSISEPGLAAGPGSTAELKLSDRNDPLAGLAVDANALAGAIWSGRGDDVTRLIHELLRDRPAG